MTPKGKTAGNFLRILLSNKYTGICNIIYNIIYNNIIYIYNINIIYTYTPEKNMIQDVKLLAAGLSVGDTLRTMCPVCEGGSTSEASFSITKDDDGVVYKCFRASCGFKGALGSKPRSLVHTKPVDTTKMDKVKKAVEIWERSYEPGDIRKDILNAMFRFPVHETLMVREDPENGRILTPLWSRGKLAAFTSRRFYAHGSPKAITYQFDPNIPAIGFWGCHAADRPLLVVEDVYSAGAMHHIGCNVCALLGTGTSEDGWLDISAFASRYTDGRICLILDEDATAVALGLKLRLRHMFKQVEVYPLKGPDLKNRTPEERLRIREDIST